MSFFRKLHSKGMSIAVAYGPGLTAEARQELARAIDRAIEAQKVRSEERGYRKASDMRDRSIW